VWLLLPLVWQPQLLLERRGKGGDENGTSGGEPAGEDVVADGEMLVAQQTLWLMIVLFQ